MTQVTDHVTDTIQIAPGVIVDSSQQEAIAFPESDPPQIVATSPEVVDGHPTRTWRIFALMTSPQGYRLCPTPRLEDPEYVNWLEETGMSHEELLESLDSERSYK